jgi:hypothetical protein
MKIEPVGLFHTPSGWVELQEWIDRHDSESKAHVMTAAVMAWNLAAKVQGLPDNEEEAA